MHTDKQHFHGLDGLRGIAAIAVLFLHGSEIFGLHYKPPSAGLAVDFFFMLSGFVLAYAYEGRLHSGQMSWTRFMVVRTIRLYPMLMVGTLLGGAVFILGQLQPVHDYSVPAAVLLTIGSLLLLPAGFATQVPDAQAYPVNNPAWSLFFEFAVSAWFGSQLGRLRSKPLAAVVAASGALLVIAVLLWHGTYQDIGFASPKAFLIGFLRVSYPFWAGVLIYRALRFRTLPHVPFLLMSLILAAILLAPWSGKLYSLMMVIVVFPLLLAYSSGIQLGRFGARVCSELGELSYPLYLVHQPILRAFRHVPAHGFAPRTLAVIGAVVAVAAAEFFLIAFDRPVRQWLARASKPRVVVEASVIVSG